MISYPAVKMITIAPELCIACSAIFLLLLDALRGREKIFPYAGTYSLLVLFASMPLINFQHSSISKEALITFSGMIILDRLAVYFNYLIVLTTGAVILMSLRY